MFDLTSGAAGLHVADARDAAPGVDFAAAERAARDFLVALGADVELEGLAETPRRMAQLYAEQLAPTPFRVTTFPNAIALGADRIYVLPTGNACALEEPPRGALGMIATRSTSSSCRRRARSPWLPPTSRALTS